jgi:hypothetical protein
VVSQPSSFKFNLPIDAFAAFKPSDFSIISADAHSDFDVEKKLSLRDQKNRKLDVKLNYA